MARPVGIEPTADIIMRSSKISSLYRWMGYFWARHSPTPSM